MHKILIVDDEEINRLTLEAGFSDSYKTVLAKNGQEALDFLYLIEDIDVIFLDLTMPEVSGFEVLQELNETGLINRIPVFVITATNNDEELDKAYDLGVVDVISKPYNLKFLRRSVENTIELYTQRNSLSDKVEEKTKELMQQNNRLVEAMANIVEFRSNESGAHVKRVRGYTRILMEGIISDYPEYQNLYADLDCISFAACLHDLGKIAVPDEILNKPGKYTPEEFEVMKFHTINGYEQILSLKDVMSPKLFEYSLDITRHHHERYDGKGYPDKLSGENITIWSQAVAIADVYDALTSDRCYKNAFDHDTACSMILNGECGAFNPKAITVFEKLKNRFDEFRHEIIRKRVLIIDDSEIDSSTLRSILIKDYDVSEIESGALALSHLRSHPNDYDALIIDVLMPNMDGFELVAKLGRTFVSRTPIIMCSGEVNKTIISKAASYGIRAFFKKPYNVDSIHEKMNKLLGDKK